MPRAPRLLLPQSFYHIMTRGNNKNIVFKDDEDYQYFLSLILKYKNELPFDIYHYCLMPNHVHFLVQINSHSHFSLFIKKLNLAYFHHFNKKYKWSGHFWQDRFKSQSVGKDEYFIQCGKYIELNPVRGGLVEEPESYPYSSCGYYINGESNSIITEDFIYIKLGATFLERQTMYRCLVMEDLILDSYKKNSWGSSKQRYNEYRKLLYYRQNKFTTEMN